MARIALVTQTVDSDGLVNPTFTTATDVTNTFSIDADAELEVVNGGGVSTTVTITPGGSIAGLAITPAAGTVIPAGQRARFGKFDKRAYARPAGVADPGKIYVGLTAVTTVTAAAFR